MNQKDKGRIQNCLEAIDDQIMILNGAKNGMTGVELEIVRSVLQDLRRAYGHLEIMFDK